MQKHPNPLYPSYGPYAGVTLNQRTLPNRCIPLLPLCETTKPNRFHFQVRDIPIDWRCLQRVNVDKIIQDTSIESLEVYYI